MKQSESDKPVNESRTKSTEERPNRVEHPEDFDRKARRIGEILLEGLQTAIDEDLLTP